MESTLAIYGRSCTRSKCRCVRHVDVEACERCHRLKKPCLSSESIRKRNTHKHETSRIIQLEEKLDGIISLLQNVTQSGVNRDTGSSSALNPDISTEHMPPGMSNQNQQSTFPTEVSVSRTSDYASRVETGTSVPTSSTLDFNTICPLAEVEGCLPIFRAHILKYFAFLHLPHDMSAQQLRHTKPFLSICIVAATSKSTERKLALGKEIKLILAQRMIHENGEKVDLDLLLGLLTFLLWGHDQLLNHTPKSLCLYTQFAVALVYDLRLNKPAPTETNMLPTLKDLESTADTRTIRNLEERRAVLGCFVLSSVISSYFYQNDVMRWTSYMEECLEVARVSQHDYSDQLFLHQVCFQQLSYQIAEAGAHRSAESTTLPPAFYLRAFQSKLDDLVAAVPTDICEDNIFLASMFSTKLSMYTMPVCKAPLTVDSAGFQRLECLYTCPNTVKSALDNFLAIPPSALLGLSFLFFAQLVQSLATLFKLSTLEDPAWDVGFVRSAVDLLVVLDQIITNLQQATSNQDDTVVTKTIRILGSVKSRFTIKLAASRKDSSIPDFQESIDISGEGMFLEGIDDLWMQDVFRTYEGSEYS